MAVSIDPLGYHEYSKRLYLALGLELSCIAAAFYNQQDKRRLMDQVYANTPARRKLQAQQRLENINKEWLKEVVDRKSGNTYRTAMMAPTVVTETPSNAPAVDGSLGEERDCPFCRSCQNYGHQRRSSKLCPKNKHYEGKCSDFDHVTLFGEPADQYLHIVQYPRTGNPAEPNPNYETSAAGCAPCADSVLTLKEKIKSLDDMVLVEENKEDAPPTDDEESVA
jgi:hypothetical protein